MIKTVTHPFSITGAFPANVHPELLEREPPANVLVRAAFVANRAAILTGEPLKVVIPNYGEILWQERVFLFTFTPRYAKIVGTKEIESRWGTSDDFDYSTIKDWTDLT